ncbi:hypothetical protein Droror1_Dr00009926 [Drosera rotundifolia]
MLKLAFKICSFTLESGFVMVNARSVTSSCFHLFRFSSSLSCAQSSKQDLPTSVPTCIAYLQSCARSYDHKRGKELHSWMLKSDFLNSPLSITSVINMYSKCRNMSYASSVFEVSTSLHNVYIYNAIIAGCVGNDLCEEGFDLFVRMRYQGVMPDKFTFPCVIKGCLEVFVVKKVHGFLLKLGLESDVFIGSALVSSYLKYGEVDIAHDVFDELDERDAVLWNSMINGYVKMGGFDLALDVFRQMSEDGVSPSNFTCTGVLSALSMKEDLNNGKAIHGLLIKKGYDSTVAISNALLDLYGKCKFLESAIQIFDTMVEKDIFTWNSLISVHGLSGDYYETMRLFSMMLAAGIKPDLVTVTIVLPACANLAALMHGKEIHKFMITNGFGNYGDIMHFEVMYLNNSLLDMYAKCGSMRCANVVFNMITVKDLAAWNIMIMGYGMHGHGEKALLMFNHMCASKLKPDGVTFVAVLSACSHAGLVVEGQKYLSEMESRFGITPIIEHYVCVINMLGRAGQLEAAYELLVTTPIENNAVAWRSFLSACELHGNADFAQVAAQHIFELEPEHCGNYVLMSNVYGAVGRYVEVSDLRLTMRDQNINKLPGCSWIEVKNDVHFFGTCDQAHPETDLINVMLRSLVAVLYEYGCTLTV